MKHKKISTYIFSCIAILLLILIAWTVWSNTALELHTYYISSEKIPQSFSGYRIAHISDLHNTEMGEDNEKLLNMIKDAKPDIIAITGDMIDSYNTNIDIALRFAREAVKIAPCFYVTGNHEARISEYDYLITGLEEIGVIVLDNDKIELEDSGESITLLGVKDPSFQSDYLFGDSETIMADTLDNLMHEEDKYSILLSHRPELFHIYVDNNIDLVLSGHAHGGQFRIPFIGGIVAPNQGLFPKYDAGLFGEKETNMIVSRGIGNSIIPFRFNNPPEIIIIELQHEE
jgi:predicted MPP superfamily phosphohydrolase